MVFDLKRRRLALLLTLSAIAFPRCAWADAGTPLMWAGIFHLVVGNALLGFAESALLRLFFSVRMAKSVAPLVLANYTSAWIGGLFIRGAIVRALPMDLNNGWTWFWILAVVTWVMTLILEWPFFASCFRGTQNWLSRSLRATFILVSASYVVLFGWYWMASPTSLYTKMRVVAPADLSLPDSVTVYFIAPAGGNVYKRPLLGGSAQEVYKLRSTEDNDRLFARPNATDKSRWDIVARLDRPDTKGDTRFVEVLPNLPVEAVQDWYISQGGKTPDTWFNFGEVPKIGSAAKSSWELHDGFWAAEGLHGSNKATGEKVQFSYETPFGAWMVRNAVHLPSDKVLFQLGNDQICAFDPVTRRVALLWHGRGPVPVIAKTNLKDSISSGTHD